MVAAVRIDPGKLSRFNLNAVQGRGLGVLGLVGFKRLPGDGVFPALPGFGAVIFNNFQVSERVVSCPPGMGLRAVGRNRFLALVKF